MAEELGLSIEVNTNKQILSSETRIFKTEIFFYQTKKIANIDKLILKISESLSLIQKDIEKKYLSEKTFLVSTLGKEFSFYVKFGFSLQMSNILERDIIFVGFDNQDEKLRSNDQRVNAFLKLNKIFNITVKPTNFKIAEAEFKKLYYVSNSNFVNFPMLSEKQQKLVEIENQNVLVQGVAGSGKTNICINKIIFTACRGYTGRILYTTYSRGLLIDTKNRVDIFKNNLKNFVEDYKNGRLVFTDKNHKKAIENRLGIYIVCDNETNLFKKNSFLVLGSIINTISPLLGLENIIVFPVRDETKGFNAIPYLNLEVINISLGSMVFIIVELFILSILINKVKIPNKTKAIIKPNINLATTL